jgi:hypothetical protein
MWQPAGRLHEFFQADTAGPFQQVEDRSVLLPARGAVAGLVALAALGAGWAFSGAALALRLATRALVVRHRGCILGLFLGGRHSWSSFRRQLAA